MTPFQENNPCNRKGPRNGQMGKKRNFIPKQNTNDLLVGTLLIGIPSLSHNAMLPTILSSWREHVSLHFEWTCDRKPCR